MPTTDDGVSERRCLSDAQYAAIGHVIVEWSFLERAVYMAFAGILPGSYTVGIETARRIRQIRELLGLIELMLPQENRERLAGFSTDVKRLSQGRHEIAHLSWGQLVSDPEALRGHADARRKQAPPGVTTAEDINALAKEIAETSNALIDFLTEAGAYAPL